MSRHNEQSWVLQDLTARRVVARRCMRPVAFAGRRPRSFWAVTCLRRCPSSDFDSGGTATSDGRVGALGGTGPGWAGPGGSSRAGRLSGSNGGRRQGPECPGRNCFSGLGWAELGSMELGWAALAPGSPGSALCSASASAKILEPPVSPSSASRPPISPSHTSPSLARRVPHSSSSFLRLPLRL